MFPPVPTVRVPVTSSATSASFAKTVSRTDTATTNSRSYATLPGSVATTLATTLSKFHHLSNIILARFRSNNSIKHNNHSIKCQYCNSLSSRLNNIFRVSFSRLSSKRNNKCRIKCQQNTQSNVPSSSEGVAQSNHNLSQQDSKPGK